MWPVNYPSEPVLTLLSPSFPRRPYKSREDNTKEKQGEGGREERAAAGPPPFIRDPHWGQRKLFLNELELLTKYGEEEDVVLYAGAAPGRHIEHLSREFFPTLRFVLVDPAPFRIRESERVKLVAGLMTDALAKEYSGTFVCLFIYHLFIIYLSIYLFILLFVYLFIYLFYSFIHLFIYSCSPPTFSYKTHTHTHRQKQRHFHQRHPSYVRLGRPHPRRHARPTAMARAHQPESLHAQISLTLAGGGD
jgi:hypothetical protein